MLTTSQGATDWEYAARFDLDSQSTGASYELQIGADQFQLSPVTRN